MKLLGLGLLLTGCFYVDPLNDPPVIRTTCTFPDAGRACDGNAKVRRGERIQLHMTVDDPDDNADPSSYRWEAFACSDGAATEDCEPVAAGELDSGVSTLEVPAVLVGARSIVIEFSARDVLGAADSDAMVFVVDDAFASRAFASSQAALAPRGARQRRAPRRNHDQRVRLPRRRAPARFVAVASLARSATCRALDAGPRIDATCPAPAVASCRGGHAAAQAPHDWRTRQPTGPCSSPS